MNGYGEQSEETMQGRVSWPVGEDRLREWIDLTKDAIFIEKPTGEILEVNRAACDMLGYTREELITMDVSKLVPPEVAEKLPRTIKQSTVKNGVYIETRELRKDRSHLPVEVSCTLVEINGQPRVIAIVRDISERKAVEGTLRESEERFRKIFDNFKDGILIGDEDGNIIDANRSACDMFDYPKEEICARTIKDIVAAELQVPSRESLEEWQNNARYVETIGVRRDGASVPIEIGNSLVEIGGQRRMISIVRDISERKQVGEKLSKSELKYRTLLENLPQRIIYKDINSVYISCNENFAMDMKMRPAEIVGRTDYDLFPRELAESYRRVDKEVLRSGRTEYFEEKYVKGRRELVVQTVKT
ncbi:MAG: PAS domain S-box protein, partial [bacterium]